MKISVWNVNIFPARDDQADDWTWEKESSWTELGRRGEERMTLSLELNWLSWELWVPSCQNLNHPPLSRWNQLFHWDFLEKYFGSSASKKMTRQMLSLCHHLLTTDGPVMLTGSTTLAGPGLQNIPRYQDEINWEIFWKLSVKANDTANAIFMPSFTNKLRCSPWLPHHLLAGRLT